MVAMGGCYGWMLICACNPTACPIHIHLWLAVENGDLDALRELQSTLWFSMTSVQNELCNRLVETLVG